MGADVLYYKAHGKVSVFTGLLGAIDASLYELDWMLDGTPDYNMNKILNHVIENIDSALETLDILKGIIEET